LPSLRSCGVGVLVWVDDSRSGKASYSEPRGGSKLYSSVALKPPRGLLEWSRLFVAESRYLPPMLPSARTPHREGKHLANRAKSVTRVRSESGHRTSFVSDPDGGDAADERRDEDGAMPPKPFSIAVYRASSLISWDVEALYGSSANQ
jgi:hypothetical protein